MIHNSISLSQPLHSRAYNELLSGKSSQSVNSSMLGSNQNILDEMGFASELRSQKTVSALLNLPTEKMAPTLKEQGAVIGSDGMISLPQTKMLALQDRPSPEQTKLEKSLSSATNLAPETKVGIALEQDKGIELSGGEKGFALNTFRAFALDGRSLNILSRIADKVLTVAEKNFKPENLPPKVEEVKKDLPLTNPKPLEVIKEKFEPSLGKLSAQYESATKGSVAIGYDRTGGTSYGTYQVASKTGTFEQFLDFLDEKSPEWAEKLREAGKANTGSRSGSVPDMWKSLAKEDPEKMRQLEHEFIVASHYEPVENYVKDQWKGEISPALKEVIFSTAVQHGVGGAKQVFKQAISATKELNTADLSTQGDEGAKLTAQAELIKNVYANRQNKFGSSSEFVQEAVKQRFVHEQNQALNMLG